MVTGSGVFQNPFAADVLVGHHSFVPPMLAYAVHRSGQRTGNPQLVNAAERTWPHVVVPANASAFDMIGAAYAYQTLTLSPARRAHLAAYMADYGVPGTGRRCLLRPRCWGNLKLVDALAVLAITGAGISHPDPARRLGNPAAARAAAAAIVNTRLVQVTIDDDTTGGKIRACRALGLRRHGRGAPCLRSGTPAPGSRKDHPSGPAP